MGTDQSTIELRTYRIIEANGRVQTVRRSDAYIAKLCMAIVGGGFDADQALAAGCLCDDVLWHGKRVARNGCSIELIDATPATVVSH